MVFEWNCGCLHLPQSALFNAVSDFGIPRGDAKFTRDFGTGVPKLRGCQNHCDTATKKGKALGTRLAVGWQDF